MKNIKYLILVFLSFGIVSCENEDDGKYQEYTIAKPLKIKKSDFENSVDIVAPIPLEESGKIYVYKNYIFVNDKYKGVHVIDNSNPAAPQKISFIKIAGNVDISVKGDYLYADSITDLMVFDISDIDNISIVSRLKDVLGNNVIWPVADIFEYGDIDYENEMIIGWQIITETRLVEDVPVFEGEIMTMETTSDASTGQGGSLARFKIVEDYLYAVDSHNINIFNIEDLSNPKNLDAVYAGFDIETIFNKGDYLFLGSMSGMYIYNIESPATPTFVSEFQHGTACDPVVVDDNYAYVTLRGGNACGAIESGLFVIDISEITKPELVTSYSLESPYGLGIKGDKLFICDGDAGLKVFDKSDVKDIKISQHFKNINTFDVIPLEDRLLMIGESAIYQYTYTDDGVTLLSTFSLN